MYGVDSVILAEGGHSLYTDVSIDSLMDIEGTPQPIGKFNSNQARAMTITTEFQQHVELGTDTLLLKCNTVGQLEWVSVLSIEPGDDVIVAIGSAFEKTESPITIESSTSRQSEHKDAVTIAQWLIGNVPMEEVCQFHGRSSAIGAPDVGFFTSMLRKYRDDGVSTILAMVTTESLMEYLEQYTQSIYTMPNWIRHGSLKYTVNYIMGAMDRVGTVTEDGTVILDTRNQINAWDLIRILFTLGIRSTLKPSGSNWLVTISSDGLELLKLVHDPEYQVKITDRLYDGVMGLVNSFISVLNSVDIDSHWAGSSIDDIRTQMSMGAQLPPAYCMEGLMDVLPELADTELAMLFSRLLIPATVVHISLTDKPIDLIDIEGTVQATVNNFIVAKDVDTQSSSENVTPT